MRFALIFLLACGGSQKPAPAPPPADSTPTAQQPPASAPPPVDQPTTVATNVPAPPATDDQTRPPAMTGDPCEGGQVAPASTPGKHPSEPSVSLGEATAGPALDKAIIRRYVKRNLQKIQYCYEKTLLAKPGIAGKIMASFTIGADGKVTKSAATGFDAEVADCIAGVIKDIEFPKPKSGLVEVNYPFTFAEGK